MLYKTAEQFLQKKNIDYIIGSGGYELRIICPSCNNPKQKCYIENETGMFHCFHCGIGGGWKGLIEAYNEQDATIAEFPQEKEEDRDLPPFDFELIETNQQRLFDEAPLEIMSYLDDRLLSGDTIIKYELGWDGRNIIIPIFDGKGDCMNFKLKPDPTIPSSSKGMFSVRGRGRKRLFNEKVLLENPETVIVCEGEWDCMLLDQYGHAAVTSTAGANSFDESWIEAFKNIEKIFICFDNDRNGVGQQAALKTAKMFYDKGIVTYIVKLPNPEETEKKLDVTDFFKKKGAKSAGNAFTKLLIKAKAYKPTEKAKRKEEPQSTIPKQPLFTVPILYSEVEEKVTQLLPGTQDVLKIVLAVAASSQYQLSTMLWLLLVDVPSSGKTDFARFIKDAECTYYLDNLTQNAFVSGERSTESERVHDLLPLLNQKCFVVKDWTSIFSLDEKMTKKLLGDLVNIYDKEFAKFSSRRGIVGYESFFSHIGCVTPATLNKHQTYMNMVGPRFLCYNMPKTSEEDERASLSLIFSGTGKRSEMEQDTRKYVSSYLQQISKKELSVKPLSEFVQYYLWLAANLIAHCRGIILMQSASFKDEAGNDVKYYDILDMQIEKPWRALYQLMALSQCLAHVVGRDEVTIDDLRIIKDVVLSSMPADRSKALRMLQEHNGIITAKELSDLSEVSTKTSRRLLEELRGLKVLIKNSGSGSIASDYQIVEKFRDFVCLSPTEFLSVYSSGTETTDNTSQSDSQVSNSIEDSTKKEIFPVTLGEYTFRDRVELMEKEKELREAREGLDRNSTEYALFYHSWFEIRDWGVNNGIFPFFAVSNNE